VAELGEFTVRRLQKTAQITGQCPFMSVKVVRPGGRVVCIVLWFCLNCRLSDQEVTALQGERGRETQSAGLG
jgi:hypothetical protein